MKPANISFPPRGAAPHHAHPPFPRKRESRVAAPCRLPRIPAFAGMTAGESGKEGPFCLSLSPAVEEGQALEEVDVLLVLQKRTVEGRDHDLGVVGAKRRHRDLV